MHKRARIFFAAGMTLAAASAGGCGGKAESCTSNCPAVAGVYSLQSSTVSGECPFPPLLPGPSLVLAQSADGRRVATQLIDPVSQLQLDLAGDLLVPAERKAGNLAQINLLSRFPRQVQANSAEVTEIELQLIGSIREVDGRKAFVGWLSTSAFLDTRAGRAGSARLEAPEPITRGAPTTRFLDTGAEVGTAPTHVGSNGLGTEAVGTAPTTLEPSGTSTEQAFSSCSVTITFTAQDGPLQPAR